MPSESQGGDPRNNAEDAYLTFMEMSRERFNAVFRSVMFDGGAFGPAEQEGFRRACAERIGQEEKGEK